MRAVVPAKSFQRAKTRLTPVLSADERAALARQMLTHVLRVVLASPAVQGALVVADDDEVAAFARALGADTLVHPPGLGPSVAAAARPMMARGEGTLVVMGDLAGLAPGDLDALFDAAGRTHVALAPDHHEDGTSALLVPAGLYLDTRFGEPGSFALHTADARARGVPIAVVRRTGLGLDIDTPADLELAAATGLSLADTRGAGSARP